MKNKRKKIFYQVGLVLLFACSACSSTNKEVSKVEESKVDKSIWGYNKTHESLDMVFTIMTNGFNTKDGYYFINQLENPDRTYIGSVFSKYDEKSGQYTIINDSDTKNCNFSNPQKCSSFISEMYSSIGYYNNKLYMVDSTYDRDTDITVNKIFEMDMQGNDRNLVFSKANESKSTSFTPYFTAGYCFLTNNGELSVVNLDTWKWTTIVNQKNANFFGLMIVNDEIYINATQYKDGDKLYPSAIFKVDYKNKKLTHVLDTEGDSLFYQKEFTVQMIDDKTYYINTQTGEKTKFSDTWGYVFHDQKNNTYLYSDLFKDESGVKKFILFTSDGTILDTYMGDGSNGLGELFENNSFIFAKHEYADDNSVKSREIYKMDIVDGKFMEPHQLGNFGG